MAPHQPALRAVPKDSKHFSSPTPKKPLNIHRIVIRSTGAKKRGRFIMDIQLIIRIGAVGIIVAVINQILSRSGRDDYALLTTLAGIVLVLMLLLPQLAELLAAMEGVFDLRAILRP
jgi:stage III sporulation protein AC